MAPLFGKRGAIFKTVLFMDTYQRRDPPYINRLHESAMDKAEMAFFLKREKGKTIDVFYLFEEAFNMELEAAALIPTDLEPSRTVLYIGAMYLAADTNLPGKAIDLAFFILSFTPYHDYRQNAKDMILESRSRRPRVLLFKLKYFLYAKFLFLRHP